MFIDNEMELEAKKPTQRRFAPCSQASKDAMTLNAAIMTDRQRSRINEGKSRHGAKACMQVEAKREQGHRHQLDKAVVADKRWKFRTKLFHDMMRVITLEVTIMRLMKMNDYRHDFTRRQFGFGASFKRLSKELVSLPLVEALAKIIDITEQF